MDGSLAIEANRQALKRVVTLLLSMAGFARRASVRSAPVRLLVHFVVGRAETAVLAFLGVPAQEAGHGTAVLPGASDLLFLSARLSALALLLAPACGTGPWTGEVRPVPNALPALLAILSLRRPLTPFPDTS